MSLQCRLSACQLTQTGKCLEGFEDATTCPNFVGSAGSDQSEPSSADESAPEASVSPGPFRFPSAQALPVEATHRVMRRSMARVIVCAGEYASGKTTLLASLYDAFQDGAVADLCFAWSDTLQGFERRCHSARAESGLTEPKTERTKPGEGLRFLHLRTWNCCTEEETDLLLGDMSGELYRNMRDSSDECAKYAFMRRADQFVVLLDGDKLHRGLHAQAFASCNDLVRALLDAGILGSQSVLSFVTTKWDLLQGDSAQEGRVSELERRFTGTFRSRVRDIAVARVAARPKTGDTPIGLLNLLHRWISVSNPLPKESFVVTSPARAFDLFETARSRSRQRR